MKILFIGNSKTYRQNFPKIFKNIVEASGKEIYIDKATSPGSSLIELFQKIEIIEKIKSEKWDYVVLQERTIKALQDDITEFKQGAEKLCEKIIENNLQTQIIYNSVWVNNEFNNEQYDKTNIHYEEIAKMTKSIISYSGNAFLECHRRFPNIELFEDDKHPSLVGAYLSACCLYDTIYKTPVGDIKYYDVLNINIANNLQKVADKVILNLDRL